VIGPRNVGVEFINPISVGLRMGGVLTIAIHVQLLEADIASAVIVAIRLTIGRGVMGRAHAIAIAGTVGTIGITELSLTHVLSVQHPGQLSRSVSVRFITGEKLDRS
jgi:hypothetical protein